MKRVLVLVTAVVAMLSLMPADVGTAIAVSAGAERRQPVSFEGHLGRATRRRLPVLFAAGVCSDGLRFSSLRQGPRSVSVRIDEVFRGDPGRVCPQIVQIRCVTVILRAPLGSRRVLDGARGTPIPRLRSGTPGQPKSCPRVAAPPTELATSRLR